MSIESGRKQDYVTSVGFTRSSEGGSGVLCTVIRWLRSFLASMVGNASVFTLAITVMLPAAFGAPSYLGKAVSGLSYKGATVNAAVNPNGVAASAYYEYGTGAGYGSQTGPQNLGGGTQDVKVSAALAGLAADTTYHYRVVMTNVNGTTTGTDQTLKTAALGIASFSPGQANAGATVTLLGIGFSGGITGVVFHHLTGRANAAFTVVSDTAMTVTVPSLGASIRDSYITVIGSSGVTVTLHPTASIIGDGAVANSGGGVTAYIESGGVMTNNGSGSCTYYVRGGGTLGGSGGGGANVAYAEPGAVVTLPGVGAVSGLEVSQSPVAVLFKYLPPKPSVTTGPASGIGFTTAALSGTVNPQGSQTSAYFEYGTTVGYGSQSAPQSFIGIGADTPANASVSGLMSGTLYHYRLVATNSGGTTFGNDATLTTLPAALGAPSYLNKAVSGVSYKGATVNAAVNPNGVAASAYYEYGTGAGYGSQTGPQNLGGGTQDVKVSAALAGLAADTTYHYRVVMTNVNGTTTGTDQTLKTAALGIASFSPGQANAGATVTLLGIGFSGGITGVVFHHLTGRANAAFTVVSDTAMTVTVPSLGASIRDSYITVIGSSGVTVTLHPTASIIGDGAVANSGGGVTAYIESGGVMTNNGSGSCTYYVRGGGTLGGSGGGGANVAYAEPGAVVTLPGVGAVSGLEVSQSPVAVLFKYLPPKPSVTTGPASGIGFTTAALSGTVNPQGSQTSAYFEYGTTVGYGSQSAPQSFIGIGADTPANASVSGLMSGTLYHYRLVATNSGGTTFGNDATLTTVALPPVITSVLTASGTTGAAFSYQIAATNSPTSYSALDLPVGLSVDLATGLISGTPMFTGISSVTIGAANAVGTTTATLAVTVGTPLDHWRQTYFGNATLNVGNNEDFDHDGIINLLEFAFGTNPTISNAGVLQYNGIFAAGGAIASTGQPTTVFESTATGIDFRALFVRRVDYVAAGLTYAVQFSANMQSWTTSAALPAVLADDGAHQIVSVPYPPFVQGKKARFFRVQVSLAP